MASVATTTARIPADTSPEVRTRAPIARTLRDGLVAGQSAGLVMAAAMMAIYTFALGQTPFLPVQTIGAYVRGSSAFDGMNPTAFATGLAMHQLGPSLAWGLAFGVLVAVIRPRGAMGLMLLGLLVGLLAQVVDVHFLLPRFAAELGVPNYWGEHVHPAVSWLLHGVFGLSLSIFPWKFDPMARRYA